MTKRMLIMLIACVVIFGGVFGFKYMGKKGMNQYFDNMPVPAATISASEAKLTTWAQQLETIGTLTAVNGIQLTTEAAGIVESILFESGDKVEKGAILLTLDADTDRADLKSFEAQSRLAQTELKRIRELHKLDSLSQADLDRAESEATQARARVLTQKPRIAKKEIRAPFTGELGIRRVDLGQYVSPGTAIVSLQALDPLYVDFSLPEQNISQVRPGQAVKVRVDLLPGEVIDGVIQAIETSVDTETRNFQVRAQISNSDGRLRPGVFARVAIALPDQGQSIIVPRTAISYNAYGNSVFVIGPPESKNNDAAAGAEAEAQEANPPEGLVARQRFVKTGEARGDFVVIVEGLEAGELIATSGLLKLRNNQPVVINNDLEPDVSLTPTPSDS